jgi:hypothetical protein
MSKVRRRVHIPGDDDGVEERMHTEERDAQRLLHRVALLETEVSLLGKAVSQYERPAEDAGSAPVNRDARWHCKKCGYLLGFYDVKDDVLRTRYKEHIVFVRAGVGGFVQIVCRGCSEVNTQQYVPPEDLSGDPQGSPENGAG